MNKLTNTEKLLSQKVNDGCITSYALLIGYKGYDFEMHSHDVDLDTYFDAASLGKIFPTTTISLKAIDEGRISFNDTLDKFFPSVPNDKKRITVRHLMTHTSGMLRREFPENVAERGRESIAEFILNIPLSYEIGTKYAYCCT